MSDNIRIERDGFVGIITIDRPEKLNAVTPEMADALVAAVDDFNTDDDIRCVILTGAGERAFCAGSDIRTLDDYDTPWNFRNRPDYCDAIRALLKPSIAAVNGYAFGGGLELAMACHLRVASQTARMGLPEVSLGLIPGYGGTQRLTQLIGRGKALEMILTGDMITADDALALGLVNHVSEPDNLQDLAFKIAEKIAHKSASAVSAAIRAVNASLDPTQDGFEIEISEFGKCFGTPDFEEGVSAFLEKRSPNF